MKITSVKKLQDLFMGKVCTILTTGIAKNNFADQQFSDFFTGIVDHIDEDGIITRHALNGCKNFYSMNYIVGILEEQFISEDDPAYKDVVQEIKRAEPNKSGIIEVDPNNSPYIDHATLASLQKQAREFNQKNQLRQSL